MTRMQALIDLKVGKHFYGIKAETSSLCDVQKLIEILLPIRPYYLSVWAHYLPPVRLTLVLCPSLRYQLVFPA